MLCFSLHRIGSSRNFVLQPWQLLLAILAGWSNRQQPDIIEYLRTENQVLKEKIGKRRILLSDDQRRRLARKDKVLASARCVCRRGVEAFRISNSAVARGAASRSRARAACASAARTRSALASAGLG
jgi:hypothetical protein